MNSEQKSKTNLGLERRFKDLLLRKKVCQRTKIAKGWRLPKYEEELGMLKLRLWCTSKDCRSWKNWKNLIKKSTTQMWISTKEVGEATTRKSQPKNYQLQTKVSDCKEDFEENSECVEDCKSKQRILIIHVVLSCKTMKDYIIIDSQKNCKIQIT